MAIKNYQYHVELKDKPDEVFWAQARSMDQLWNAFVQIRKDFLETIKPLYEKEFDEALLPSFRELVRAQYENLSEKRLESLVGKGKSAPKYSELTLVQIKKLRWQDFEAQIVSETQKPEWKAQLGWEAREAVYERFKVAASRALKEGAELRVKPNRITQISFYHRFSAGGMATNKIFTNAGKKFSLAAVDDEFYDTNSHQNRHRRYSKCVFGIGLDDQPLRMSVYLHREIPQGKLKVARFVGKFEELTREWTWTLVLAVETIDVPQDLGYKPVAAIDINWRRRDEFLRIGFVKDTAGNDFEIRLPIYEPLSRRAKNLAKAVNGARRHQNLPPVEFKDLFPRDILEIGEWQERADALKDAVKAEIQKVYETAQGTGTTIPAHAKNFLQFYSKIGRRGLLKLLWQSSGTEDVAPTAEDAAVIALLEPWKEKDYRLRLSIHQSHKYLTNKRKKLYENLALWLKRTYSAVVWEGDLSLKQMAEEAPKISMDSDRVALRLGNKFRQYAGLSVLRGKIKEHGAGCDWLIGAPAANTTRICRTCQEFCEPTANRLLQCPNGHVMDQDANACSNLLDAVEDDRIYSTRAEAMHVPPHLENYIVPVVVDD